MASLVLSVQLLQDGRATAAVTQVSLEQCLEDVSAAQQELVTATDADPQRRATASAAVREAADALVALGGRRADELGFSDREELQKVERTLAAAAAELQA